MKVKPVLNILYFWKKYSHTYPFTTPCRYYIPQKDRKPITKHTLNHDQYINYMEVYFTVMYNMLAKTGNRFVIPHGLGTLQLKKYKITLLKHVKNRVHPYSFYVIWSKPVRSRILKFYYFVMSRKQQDNVARYYKENPHDITILETMTKEEKAMLWPLKYRRKHEDEIY